jgi:glycosyl-4,4'-diaponeurosporenoate acyltransferase
MQAEPLGVWGLVVVNTLAWLLIHLGVAGLGTQIPSQRFNPASWLFRQRRWERGGRFYEKMFAIKTWKPLLPDGAALFKSGFRKKRIRERGADYLNRFSIETCRSEAVHWIVLGSSLLFFSWNSWGVGLAMVAYGMVANLPCILAQRYNRLRLTAINEMKSSRKPGRCQSTSLDR